MKFLTKAGRLKVIALLRDNFCDGDEEEAEKALKNDFNDGVDSRFLENLLRINGEESPDNWEER